MTATGTGVSRTNALLAIGIAGTWLAVHLGGIFMFPLERAWPLAIPLVALQAWLSTGLFITAHDCMHGSFAPAQPRLNRFVGRAVLMMYAGLDYDRLLPAHHGHHRHVGTGEDPDFNAADPRHPVRWLVKFFGTYYTHAQIARITVVACLYLALGASLVAIVVFWAIPALVALVQLFYFGTYLPHRHVGEGGGAGMFVDHHNSRGTGHGRVASLLTCFNFGGYHHEHHLHPNVPWWRLPATRTAD